MRIREQMWGRPVRWAGLAVVAIAVASAGCDSRNNGVSPLAPSAVSSNSTVGVGLSGSSAGTSNATVAGKPAGNIAVTTTIADSLNGFPLRVRSDGLGPYTNTSPTQSLIIEPAGQWALTTYTIGHNGDIPGNRAVFFDLTEPVSPGNPPPPFQTATVQGHLIDKTCNVSTIPVGTTTSCSGDFRFDMPNGLAYRLSYAPANFPEVNSMDIKCLAADSNGCSQWTVTTEGKTLTGNDPNPKGVQKLVQVNPTTDAVIAQLGDYYISFSISFSR